MQLGFRRRALGPRRRQISRRCRRNQQQQQQQPNVAHMAASPRVEALASGLGAAQGGVFGAIVVMPLDMVASKQACGDGAPVASVPGPPRPCAQPPAAKLPCEQPAPE